MMGKRAEPKTPHWAASIAIRTKEAGYLKIGDGFGIPLNRRPSDRHLRMMGWFFGWTWVESIEELAGE